MARRKRGDIIDGWLILDKPEGVGSTEAVGRARRVLGARKAGHAGTLDPLATGLLAIAFGEATKTIPVAQEGAKTYRFTVRFGQRTTTDDREGTVTDRSDRRPEAAEIEAALPGFRGDILQVPPAFSAVRTDGRRAYDVVRGGGEVVLKPRPLTVHRLEIVDRPDPDHAVLEMVCAKGGYVRSIARDLGAALGCHGHVAALRRLASGHFSLDGAFPWEAMDDLTPEALLPVAAGLAGLPGIPVPPAVAVRLRLGQAVPVAQAALGLQDGAQAWTSDAGQPVAIGTVSAGCFHPARGFIGSKPGTGISGEGEA